MRVTLLALAILFGPSATALANEIALEGTFQQGGLVQGRVPPGTEVRLGERRVRVGAEGRFIIGFGRDHGPEAVLSLRYPDGQEETSALTVAARDYKIQRIDGLPPKKVNPPEEVMARIAREQAIIVAARNQDRPEADYLTGFRWPAIGPISGVYGSQRVLNGEPRRPHFGVDIAAAAGTPILAPADGVVTLAEPDLYFSGGTVFLDHGHGLSSAFLHLQSVTVAVGDRLRQGDPLGTLGATGRATGPHLDWRMNWFDQRVDPAFLVGPMPEG